MQVCDRAIRECVDRGARTVDDVGRACGAGVICRGCRPTIEALVAGEPADPGVISLGKARPPRRAPDAAPLVSADDALAS
jgi:bacterioferritin-associated ferredoxin